MSILLKGYRVKLCFLMTCIKAFLVKFLRFIPHDWTVLQNILYCIKINVVSE